MKRFSALIMGALLSVGMIDTPIAIADDGSQSGLATAANSNGWLSGKDIVNEAEASVDQFAVENGLSPTQWANLADMGVTYNPCGPASASYAYYYCPRDSVAYIGYAQAEGFNDGTNNFAAAVLVAHEWGHHLQHVMNPGIRFSSKSYENGADCVGGAWLKWFVTRAGVNLGISDVDGFWRLAIKIETHGETGDTHGTRYERAFAMFSGYTWGLASCNGYAPTVPLS